jgi:hypothetical protein
MIGSNWIMIISTTVFFFTQRCTAQSGFQVGFDGCSVINTNQQTLVYPFTPVVSYEMALVQKININEKLAYKIELGFINKGGLQSSGGITKTYDKHAIGYGYLGFNLLYKIAENWVVKLGVQPSYLMLYKKYSNGNVSNYITSIDRRFKVDAPVCFGISKAINEMHEFTLQGSYSTAPFAVQKNLFPTPSTDKFYHVTAAFIYTFYFASNNTD